MIISKLVTNAFVTSSINQDTGRKSISIEGGAIVPSACGVKSLR
jgi:hypothetical protein